MSRRIPLHVFTGEGERRLNASEMPGWPKDKADDLDRIQKIADEASSLRASALVTSEDCNSDTARGALKDLANGITDLLSDLSYYRREVEEE